VAKISPFFKFAPPPLFVYNPFDRLRENEHAEVQSGFCPGEYKNISKFKHNKTMDDQSSELHDSTQKLLHDLRQVVQDGEEVLRAGVGELGEKGIAARAKLSAALDSAKETARKLQSKTVAGAKATDKVIREHPYQSIGIAFGLGLLIGVLVNRK
jgi:ElaB/YqjD/DUF883 family membrane-anchored ribosome-binding protein